MSKWKPQVGDIIDIANDLRTNVYGGVFGKFASDERYYELDFASELGLPDEFKAEGVVLPTARDIVDAAVDHTDISNARVIVNKKGISDVSAASAEMMRKFYLGVINRTNVESPISPWRTAAKHFWLHGVTYMKTVWDADRWPDKPNQKDDESEDDYASRVIDWQGKNELDLPIRILVPNPANIMPDPDHVEPEFFIEEHERTCFNITRRYPTWKNPGNKKAHEFVRWTEYWDDTYKCFLADGQPVLKTKDGIVKHNYGFLPYTEIDSGLGNMSKNGDLDQRWVGLLRYVYDILVSESRNYSVNDIVLKLGAFPWGYLSGENAKLVTKLDKKFGHYQVMPEGVTVHDVVPQTPPDAVFKQQLMSSDILHAHAAPRSVMGMGETGVRSGADRRLVISEATLRYSYSTEAFKHGTAKVLANCAKLYKHVIPGNVRLWAHTTVDDFDTIIKKDMMTEPFTCYVEFAPLSEEDEYRRHDDLMRLVGSGVVTKEWARTQMSNVDPVAMGKSDFKESLRETPAYQQALNEYVGAKTKEAFTKRLMADGVLPPPEVPQQGQPTQEQPMPGGITTNAREIVTPGGAQDLQNQLANMRSQTPMSATQGLGGGGARPQ